MAVRFRASMSEYASLSVQFARAQLHELFETVGEDGFTLDFDHSLRFLVGKRSETGAFASG